MADFNQAHKFVAKWEGGFVNHPSDPGGATKFGVSLRWLKSLGLQDGDIDRDNDIDIDDVRALTPEDAARLFKQKFWDKYKLSQFSQKLATVYYDSIVNCGPSQATKFMQRGYNAVCPASAPRLDDDGILGPKTREALTTMADKQDFLLEVLSYRETFYRDLAKKSQYQPFLKGWLNRTNDLRSSVVLA